MYLLEKPNILVWWFVYLIAMYLFIYSLTYRFIYLFIDLSIHLSITYWFIYQSIYLYIYLFVYLCVHVRLYGINILHGTVAEACLEGGGKWGAFPGEPALG